MRGLYLAIRLVALPISLVISGCHQNNTQFPPGFSVAQFDRISKGMPEAEVVSILGKPFEEYTHMKFKAGGSNNYPGRLTDGAFPGGTVDFYFLVYSKPKHPKADYIVYEVFLDVSGFVVDKAHRETD